MKFFLFHREYDRGVTLYLAIIVLFLILGIGLGISTMLVSQLKTFRGVGSSLQAFYAADSGIDMALAVQDCIDDHATDSMPVRRNCIREVIDNSSMPPASCAPDLDDNDKKIDCLVYAIGCHEGDGSCTNQNRVGGPAGPLYEICNSSECSILEGGVGSCLQGSGYCAESIGNWNLTNRRVYIIRDFE